MKSNTTRRELFCTFGRYVTLGGLAFGAARLVGRTEKGSGIISPGECTRQFKCARCDAASDCMLPEGVAAREIFRQGPVNARQNRTRSVSEG